MATGVQAGQIQEDGFTGAIEAQTAKFPSSGFLGLALGSIALSAGLKASGKNDAANFVGHWAPTFLLLGIYNKLVKQLGSDATKNGAGSSNEYAS